jgi:hypothetical protein
MSTEEEEEEEVFKLEKPGRSDAGQAFPID